MADPNEVTPPEEDEGTKTKKGRARKAGDQLGDPVVDPMDNSVERSYEEASADLVEEHTNYEEEPHPNYRAPVYD